mgnify:CR=1 FL=1
MLCPTDNSKLERVLLLSHYDASIYVDQCSICGGIWFDESELFMVKKGQEDKLKHIDSKSFKETSYIKDKVFLCPKDKHEMVSYQDSLLPKDIIIKRCPHCSGLWLNKADLTTYQKHRSNLFDKIEKQQKDKKFEDQMGKYLSSYSQSDLYNQIGEVGKFLSTPVRQYGYSDYAYASQSEKTANEVANIAIIIIRIILSVIFKSRI